MLQIKNIISQNIQYELECVRAHNDFKIGQEIFLVFGTFGVKKSQDFFPCLVGWIWKEKVRGRAKKWWSCKTKRFMLFYSRRSSNGWSMGKRRSWKTAINSVFSAKRMICLPVCGIWIENEWNRIVDGENLKMSEWAFAWNMERNCGAWALEFSVEVSLYKRQCNQEEISWL